MITPFVNLVQYFRLKIWVQPKRNPGVIVFFAWVIFGLTLMDEIIFGPPMAAWWGLSHTVGSFLVLWTCFGIGKITNSLREQRKYLFILLEEIAALDPDKAGELKRRYPWLSDKSDYA